MNVQPYNQKEQDAATAAGFPVIRDWAEGLTLLRLGFRKMDDALPGRNEALAAEGYKQAVEGTKIIHDFFKARGLDLSA
ncbi:hypothetical protein H1O16_gp156 [Burkholderia phage BcepSaruman]|uniref:Uncharacterized protein n=1 Tax=Burkholderia phage BcepSaruman TaxID=2530032 RepID=A0A4D5ZCZ9_9CAUD|nr:hypothetical protein H1O16_gp156 [Burkholderia phage BcepSaruman]QBX06569.1 hypothetical protein BcepSaruman_156 [Burkholderia phage BcepSaruman]